MKRRAKHTETLYDSFNARNIPIKEVARTFVVNEDYRRLLKNSSIVLMGPRGSGKTTLLKMLTLEALHSWPSAEAKETLRTIPFCAVYIPTDVHWKRQLAHTERSLEGFPKFARRVSEAAVTLNALKALLHAFSERIEYKPVTRMNWIGAQPPGLSNGLNPFRRKRFRLSLSAPHYRGPTGLS